MRVNRGVTAEHVRGPAQMEPVRVPSRTVLVAADHILVGQALAQSLAARGYRAEAALGASANPDELVERVRILAPDVVLLAADVAADSSATARLLRRLREFGPRVVLVATGPLTMDAEAECLGAGAAEVLDASYGLESLAGALGATGLNGHGRLERLTQREREILAALMDGRCAEAIASRQFVSVTTVRSQIRAILRKLEVNSQLAAVAEARRAGWEYPIPAPGQIHQSWG